MDDEDEWEYEYSATETETYYLTLDLSVRDFLERRTDDIVHNTRSGYRVWYNPLFNAPEQRPGNAGLVGDAKNPDDGDAPERDLPDLDNIGLPQPDIQSEPPIDPLLQQQAEGEPNAQKSQDGKRAVEEIQILDLHSKEPIVSYRNHAFRGSWAENIGTEMIFTKHDANDPLPAMHDLGRNIDLLAASSARINFKEITLVPKDKLDAPKETMDTYEREDDIPDRYKRNGGIYIHIGGDKNGQRQPQAHFLEDLISLKRKRGEVDEVTIQPLETKQNKLMVEDVGEERRRRKQQVDYERTLRWRTQRKGENGEALTAAEDQYIARQLAQGGEDHGQKRKRGGSRRRTRAARLIRRQSPPPGQPRPPGGSKPRSTPTPARWDDLQGNANTKDG